MNLLTNVRRAEVADLENILHLVKELAEYEKAPDQVTATLQDYRYHFELGIFESFVVERSGHQPGMEPEVLGIAVYYYGWSTWKGKMLYLEDFVVKESERGNGIGKLLFDKILEEAKTNECVMLKWQVLDWNIPAIRFYEKYKADFDKGWWNGRIFFN